MICVQSPPKRTLFDVLDRSCFSTAGDPNWLPIAMLGFMDRLDAALGDVNLEAVRAGKVGLLLDNSMEGHAHAAARSAEWHRQFRDLGIPAPNVVHVTQNRSYATLYREWVRAEQVVPMRVLVYDYFLKQQFNNLPSFEDRLRAFETRPKVRRRFLALNYKPRPHRVALLARLLRDGLWDKGHISFGGFEENARIQQGVSWSRAAGMSEVAMERDIASIMPYVEALDRLGVVSLDSLQRNHIGKVLSSSLQNDPVDAYDDTWFTVTTETGMGPNLNRITEKTPKPFLNFHPSLIFGGVGALALARELGFRTFSNWFDESYDLVKDRHDRFDCVYAELVRLSAMTDAEWLAMEIEMRPLLIENAEAGLIKGPELMRRRDKTFVDTLEAYAAASKGQ
jgi:hypothetical protein